jgi:ribosomal protein S18 acetylase RimI-like enzyme
MTAPNPSSSRNTRALVAADLERVIAIDRIHSGRSRRHFFEKRFANAQARPDDFVQIGVATGEGLQGFAIARILRGEFGQKDAIAVLDAVGVDPQSHEHGLGQSLMEGLVELSGKRGARSVQSHVSWTNLDLLRFFNASRFKLAPRLDLERPVADLREDADEEP